MNNLNINDLDSVMKIVKMKRENPKEYEEFMDGMFEVFIDMKNRMEKMEE